MEVRWALNIFEGSSGLVRFHGTPRALVEAYAERLGLRSHFARTLPPGPGETDPRRDFETALEGLLEGLKAEGAVGVLFGNLHLEEIRAWYEARVTRAGLEHREPLWGVRPADVTRAVPAMGFRARVISVNLELGDPDWLGRELTPELARTFARAGIDPAGERGEYHTFVYDGPGFRTPVPHRIVGAHEREGHRYLEIEPLSGQ